VSRAAYTMTLALAALWLLVGCTTTSSSMWPERSTFTQTKIDRLQVLIQRQQMSKEASKLAFNYDTWHLGDVPAVNSVLPLLSPDGSRMAVNTGTEPSMATRLAQPDAPIPTESGIAIWQILPGRGGLKIQTTLEGPLLLTDSADETGFLVERPNHDGSRWIGKVDWNTGELHWLVTGPDVAVYPALGHGGRLAWSERSIDGDAFDLVIRFSQTRSGDQPETVIPHGDGDWLLPSWSGRSNRLAVYRVTSTQLQLFSLDANSPESLQEDLRHIPVLAGGRRVDALLAAAGRNHVVGLPRPPLEEVFYYDPRQQRMMLWLPTGLNWDQPMPLADLSVAAVHDDRGGYLLTLPDGLYWQDRNDHRKLMRIELIPWIARRTSNPLVPYLLLQVGHERVTVQAMRPDRRRNQPVADAEPAS
jgi:hypothetical protein